MTIHAIIRNGVRTLVASLLAAILLALLAFPAQAGAKNDTTGQSTGPSGSNHSGWNLGQNKKAARVTNSGGTKGPIRQNTVTTTGAKVH